MNKELREQTIHPFKPAYRSSRRICRNLGLSLAVSGMISCGAEPQESLSAVQSAATSAGSWTMVIYADKDTRLTRAHKNRNDGRHTRLSTQKWNNGHGKVKVLVNFPLGQLYNQQVSSARLEFRNVVKPAYGKNAEHGVRRMIDTSWEEGNRKSDNLDCIDKTPGSGAGVTWGCFRDEIIDASNTKSDCAEEIAWTGAPKDSHLSSGLVENDYTDTLVLEKTKEWREQIVAFDVTQDIQEAVHQQGSSEISWLLERSNRGKGRVKLGSREWAQECMGGDLNYGPRLVLEIQ